MLELLFFIFLFGIFGKLFFFGMRAAWSISKLLITIVFLPVILLGMVFGGLFISGISDPAHYRYPFIV